jgi:hypothetical protein
MMSNSKATDSLYLGGNVDLAAECLVAVGEIVGENHAHTNCYGKVREYSLPTEDPYATVQAPSAPAGCKPTNVTVLEPGTYCNGLTINKDRQFKPGVYVINGNFSINGNSDVSSIANASGDIGNMFYVTGGGTISMNGTATINLKGMKTGDYSGLLFFADRATAGLNHTLNGTASSKLTGAIYAPAGKLQHNGNFSGDGNCMQLIGDTIVMKGTSQVSSDCTDWGMQKIKTATIVQLIK